MIPPPKKPKRAKSTRNSRAASIFLDDDDSAPLETSETAEVQKVMSEAEDAVAELEKLLSSSAVDKPASTVKKTKKKDTRAVVAPSAASQNPDPEPEIGGNVLDAIAGDDDFDLDGSLPDIVSIVDRAIASDLDPSIFTEKSFPVAPNVIEWCRNPMFLGYSRDLFPRQVQVLAHFFGDVCYFCSDAEYIHNVPVRESLGNVLDRFTLLQYGVCPKCKRNRTEIYKEWFKDPRFAEYTQLAAGVDPVAAPPNEFVGVWGQRSGKSHTISTFSSTYVLHRYLALPSPTRYFFQPNNTMFEMSFVAPTLRQVEDNAWAPFQQALYDSPWFREVRNSFIEDGKRLGVRTFHSGSTFMMFENKRLVVHMKAAHGSNLRGATRLAAVIDELGWFNITEDGKVRTGVRDGTAVLDAMSNSLITIRSKADMRRNTLNDYNALDGYIFLISSPASIADPIMTKAATAPHAPRMYYTHYATHEMNPTLTEEFIRTQLARNDEAYWRDFCAIPPRASNPFFSDTTLLQGVSVEPDPIPMFKYSIESARDEGEVISRLLPTPYDIRPDLYNARVLAVDNGESKNAFALAIGRYDPETEGMLLEEFIEVAPYRGHVVDLAWCYDKLILPLVNSYKFLHVAFDRWNSAYAVYDLRTKLGIDAQIYTLKWKDFEAYREDLRGMKIRTVAPEIAPDELLGIKDPALRSKYPRAHFQLQLTTVNQFGNKLLKPDNDNDDLFRVSVLAHRFLTKFKEDYKKFTFGAGRRRPEFRSVGVFRGASRRSSGGNSYSDPYTSPAPASIQQRTRPPGPAGITRSSSRGRSTRKMRG